MVRTYKPKISELPDKFTKGVLARLDGRTDLKKRLSFTYNRLLDDCGGIDALPHTKVALVERFAWLEEFLRQIESKLADGVADQGELLGRWIQGVNGMTGLAKLLGVTSSQPKDYIDTTLYAPADPRDTPEKAPGSPRNGRQGSNRGPSTRSPAPQNKP